jgi:predicted transposase/invertase (TIGR01784 family)
VDLAIVNAQIPVDRGTEKKSIFDIRAKYNNGRQAVIEMQKEATPGFKKRSQHIISKAYGSQEISGEDYDKLEKCYVICITNFNVIKKTTDYIKDYRFRDRQGNDLTDDETIVFLDLSKIEAVLTKPVDEMTNVEKWAVFFKYVGDESKRDILNNILEGAEGIQMATNILLTVSKDEEARAQYESELRFQLDQSSRMAGAKKEGRKEAQIEMAKKMLKRGISIEDVLEDSGLTIEELED